MLLNFFLHFLHTQKMLFNGAKPQTPLPSRNQTKQALHTQCCKMGHSPKPHTLHELVERKIYGKSNTTITKNSYTDTISFG